MNTSKALGELIQEYKLCEEKMKKMEKEKKDLRRQIMKKTEEIFGTEGLRIFCRISKVCE